MIRTIILPPPPETGVHACIFNRACCLREAGASIQSARCTLFKWRDSNTFREGRTVSDCELENALRSAFNLGGATRWKPRLSVPERKAAWPKASPEQRAKLIDSRFGLADLWETSPVRWTDGAPHTRHILEALYPNNPLLCCGWTQSRFDTRPRSEWWNAEGLAFITPSPMSAKEGRRKHDGKLSAHTLDNTGPRLFLVLDYDDNAGSDVHAATTVYLQRVSGLPLVLVLHSGGKSLHAWFHVANRPESQVRQLMHAACILGADPRMWTRSQFARMPDGLRDNGKRQTVYYFNPEVL